MKRISAEELLAMNPDIDPEELEAIQRMAERLKEAGFEGARYRLATPLTGKYHSDHRPGSTRGRLQPHAHSLMRRH